MRVRRQGTVVLHRVMGRSVGRVKGRRRRMPWRGGRRRREKTRRGSRWWRARWRRQKSRRRARWRR